MDAKPILIIFGLTLMLIQQKNNAQTNQENMKTENANKVIIKRIYEEALNKRKMQLLEELVADEFIGVRGLKGASAIKAAAEPLISAFPDIQWKIEELLADENKVVIKWRWQGLSVNKFQNLAGTNKVVSNEAVAIYELKNERVVAAYVLTDRLGFLQQMNAVPNDVNLISNKPVKDRVQFIDKFIVPAKSRELFMSRVRQNRSFIKTLPGFIEDHAYESIDENGDLIFVTIAVWESMNALKAAKETVQTEYKKQGFDMPSFLQQLQITMDRRFYNEYME